MEASANPTGDALIVGDTRSDQMTSYRNVIATTVVDSPAGSLGGCSHTLLAPQDSSHPQSSHRGMEMEALVSATDGGTGEACFGLSGASVRSNGPVVLDLSGNKVWLNGKRIRVSKKQFALLSLLLENVGVTISNRRILETVWGKAWAEDRYMQYVRVAISTLRNTLQDRTRALIASEWGVGYRMEPDDNQASICALCGRGL